MVTPNYAYEKRQRELAKKKKKAEKAEEKAARKAHGGPPGETDGQGGRETAGLPGGGDVAELPHDGPPPTADAPTGGLAR